jgi:hypothetical protein
LTNLKPVSSVTRIYSSAEAGTHLNISVPELSFLFLLIVDKELRGKGDGNFLWGDIATVNRRFAYDSRERVWRR